VISRKHKESNIFNASQLFCLFSSSASFVFFVTPKKAVGPANVVGVSYELLLEEGTAMEAFLVCNATLRLQADAYYDCAATFAGFKTVHAKSKAI
jgi:hypothetical protein